MEMLKPKRLVVGLIALGGICALPASVYAVTGICSTCHTMHYSQNNLHSADMAVTLSNADTVRWAVGAKANLLNKDCAGCHADGSLNVAGTTINDDPTPVPQVGYDTRTVSLAGGYFSETAADSKKMHNVAGLTSADENITDLAANGPPGWNGGAWEGDSVTKQVTCSGSTYAYGCHRAGGHHANKSGKTDGTAGAGAVGDSFRFLSGVKGVEEPGWEVDEDPTMHNSYYAAKRELTDPSAATVGADDSINGLCAKCHGDFHGVYAAGAGQDNDGSWIRHPTDVDLSTATYTGTEYASYTAYQLTVPVGAVAYDTAPITNPRVDGGIVLCISCHRAHGSANDDLLRWSYNGMIAGSATSSGAGTGCFVCHSTKD